MKKGTVLRRVKMPREKSAWIHKERVIVKETQSHVLNCVKFLALSRNRITPP